MAAGYWTVRDCVGCGKRYRINRGEQKHYCNTCQGKEDRGEPMPIDTMPILTVDEIIAKVMGK